MGPIREHFGAVLTVTVRLFHMGMIGNPLLQFDQKAVGGKHPAAPFAPFQRMPADDRIADGDGSDVILIGQCNGPGFT